MMTKTSERVSGLYDDLKAAGAQIDNHESDLYTPDTPEARELCRQYGQSFSAFTSDGKQWLDIPFAYAPWWRART